MMTSSDHITMPDNTSSSTPIQNQTTPIRPSTSDSKDGINSNPPSGGSDMPFFRSATSITSPIPTRAPEPSSTSVSSPTSTGASTPTSIQGRAPTLPPREAVVRTPAPTSTPTSMSASTPSSVPKAPMTPPVSSASAIPAVEVSPNATKATMPSQAPATAIDKIAPQSPTSPAPVAPDIQRKLSTSVRTMKDDIELLKRGVLSATPAPQQRPAINTEAKISTPPSVSPPSPIEKPTALITPIIAPTSTPTPVKQIMPATEVPIQTRESKQTPPNMPIAPESQPTPPIARTLPPPFTPTPSAPPSQGIPTSPSLPNIPGLQSAGPTMPSVPPSRGGADVGIKPLYLIIVLVLLLVLGIGIYFIATSGGSASTSKSPAPSQSIASSQSPAIQTNADSVYRPTVLQIKDTDNIGNLRALLKAYNVPQGQVLAMAPNRIGENSRMILRDFMAQFGVPFPSDLDTSFLNTRDYIYGVTSEQATDPSQSSPVLRPFIVIRLNSLGAAQSSLQTWEPSLLPSLSPILDYTPSNTQFKQEFINGTPFRYTQSPDAQHGVAYIIVDQYLLIASSRESFRTVSDKLFSLANPNGNSNTNSNASPIGGISNP